jgi:DNA polymerase III subunit epsilon
MKSLNVDFETGGLSPMLNAPVSLGIALMDGLDVLDSREWLIRPPRDKNGRLTKVYDMGAMEIHKISWKGLAAAPTAAQVVAEVRKQVMEWDAYEMPRKAFNASFDYGFWQTLIYMAGEFDRGSYQFVQPAPMAIGTWQCVMERARYLLPGLVNHKLDTVAAHFGLKRSGEAHGALEDAILCGRVDEYLSQIGKEAQAVPA